MCIRDRIYVPTDNTVANNTEIVNNICQPAGVPVVAGEEGIMSGCGVATLSISYYDLGVATGKMAAKILTCLLYTSRWNAAASMLRCSA